MLTDCKSFNELLHVISLCDSFCTPCDLLFAWFQSGHSVYVSCAFPGKCTAKFLSSEQQLYRPQVTPVQCAMTFRNGSDVIMTGILLMDDNNTRTAREISIWLMAATQRDITTTRARRYSYRSSTSTGPTDVLRRIMTGL